MALSRIALAMGSGYTQVGPDHNRSFIAEMTIYIKQLGRRIFAREHGSNKKLAAQSCALNLE
ncbi:putative dsRNA-binding protein, partial [Morganella morganii]|uniref:putative dsRNA-binding protein n=1 Tax=Morganella morganii TaxID=582 RepID=UPI0019534F61